MGLLRKSARWLVILAVIAVGLAVRALSPGSPSEIVGTGEARDGDSVTIGEHRVRLEGIDAPERAQTCMRDGRSWPCGRAAQIHLARLIANHAVSCSVSGRDRYERLIARCQASGRDLNRGMVRDGMAVALGEAYRAEERAARQERAGLWAGTFERPAVWRRDNPRR